MFTVSQHPHPSSDTWWVVDPHGSPFASGTFDYCAYMAARCQRLLELVGRVLAARD